ncbi:dCMP deaminase [Suillus plorans]|uniref:Deoxycytidylate deaminase n=1 Tax=Suillus plorans TaxID=116603 RepID=A0A9P7AUT1_9AGAM|nr:dCMP deaminase [Suillus plorans]KAG1795742.1 dCMP deaminase [Suillus plorans]
MFIAIIGLRFSGKSTVENYLATKDFTSVHLHDKDVEAALLLDHVTQHWRSNFVTTDLDSDRLVNYFIRRPFFMLISIDAPILQRYHRFSLLRRASPQVKLKIVNSFDSITELYHHLDSLDITNTNRLRPQWDTYFMTLADLASQRSNCMKRRVGAILVRENRIVSTGYNGTPRGVKNCNDGRGCGHCNRTSATNGTECLCLHAEENALLEAGRDRVGANATMYCNTCPCLKCTIKIIQSGVKRVVYNLSYKVDDASARLFQEAGVDIFRHVPPPES